MKKSELKSMILEVYRQLNEGERLWADKSGTKPYVDALTKLGKEVGWAKPPEVTALGGTATILWTFTFDKKSDWNNGIMQNGLMCVFHVFPTGAVELAHKSYKVKTKFRKARFKDVNGMVKKLKAFVDAGKKETTQ